MKTKTSYFFFILLLCGMPVLYGQEDENTPPLPPSAGPEGLRAGGNDFGFDEITGEIRSRLDSLQSELDSLNVKAAGHLAEAEEKAAKLASRIDSLRAGILQGFGNPGGLRAGDKLRMGKVPALNTEGLSKGLPKVGALPTEDLSKVGISSLEQGIPGGDLTERIDEQIRNLGGKVQGLGAQAGLRQYKGQYSQMIKDPSQIDQLADARVSQMAELKELGAQAEELEGLKGLPGDMLADLKRYQDEQALKEELKQRAVQKATDYLSAHMDKLTKAQGAMSALKKKYSYVPDSRDLSTAVKNTSLKNEPLKRRFRYGLGFQIHRTDPVSLDLSPNVQYRFNKLFSMGVSGTYRANLQIENTGAVAKNTVQDVYGAGALARYRLSFIKPGNKWLGGFFAHAGFEYMSTRPQKLKTHNQTLAEEPARTWHPGLPVGIGKQMRLSKALTGVIIITYDVLHDEYSANPKAWNIKFGFQVGRFRLKDIRL